MRFAADPTDRPNANQREVLRSGETKTEQFGQNDKKYLLRSQGEGFKPCKTAPAVKHGEDTIMARFRFAASGTDDYKNLMRVIKN